MIELLWLLPVILIFVVFEAWFVYDGRPRGPKDRIADHAHRGHRVSEHEVAGRQHVVYRCSDCEVHFTGVH